MVPCTIAERLRGKVRVPVNDGAGLLNGLDYFERVFPTSKLAMEAADKIDRLHLLLEEVLQRPNVELDERIRKEMEL